jgi:hypothetical protein
MFHGFRPQDEVIENLSLEQRPGADEVLGEANAGFGPPQGATAYGF